MILIALGAGLAVVYGGWFCWRDPSWLRSAIKTGAVALPAIALGQMGVPGVALAGLWACALGDYLLSRPAELTLKAGIGAFALGHILYVVGFVSLFDPGRPDLLFWTVTGGLIALGASTELWLSAHTGPLRPLVRIYVGLILGMGICAALPGLPREFLLTGALSFVASDLILSTLIFLGWTARWASYAVWGLYWLAQALIMAGFWQVAAA